MERKGGKFTFKVPDSHADAGKKIEKTFEYDICQTQAEAEKVMAFDKDGKPRKEPWSLVDMVNETIKANARSNAYQTALLPYKPSEVSAEDIQERMVRDFIRSGVSEVVARKIVSETLAATQAIDAEEVPESL